MKILGESYRVLDTFDGDMTVPDCLVASKNKLGKGHGEAKLYVASKDVMRSFYGRKGFSAVISAIERGVSERGLKGFLDMAGDKVDMNATDKMGKTLESYLQERKGNLMAAMAKRYGDKTH